MSGGETVRRFIDPAAETLLECAATPRRALFLDRDGVINVDHGYVHTPEQTEWIPGIFELVKEALAAGYLPIVVTNQAGIAKGYYTQSEFLAYTSWMHDQFHLRDAPLLATYFCPHHPEAVTEQYRQSCACRKPEPGMLLLATSDWALDAGHSILVGDKDSDLQAARSAGLTQTRLIDNGRMPHWPIRFGRILR